MDLTLIEIISGTKNKSSNETLLSKQDMEFHEKRKQRKIRKLDFEVR
jgi:hypothetical protein